MGDILVCEIKHNSRIYDVSFHVLLSRDFSRLPQMESLLAGLLLHGELTQTSVFPGLSLLMFKALKYICLAWTKVSVTPLSAPEHLCLES